MALPRTRSLAFGKPCSRHGFHAIAVVKHQCFLGKAQGGKAVVRLGGSDAAFAVAPACANGKIHAEHVFARAVPAVGGYVEHALAVFGNGVAVVPVPPIIAR